GVARGGNESAAFRFWANEFTVVVLKPNFDSIGLEAISLADGVLRWQINEAKTPGILHNLVLSKDALHGLHYSKDEAAALILMSYRLDDGKQLHKQIHRGSTKPEAWLPGPLRGDHAVIHVSDEQKRQLMVLEAASGKIVYQLEVKGFGQW